MSLVALDHIVMGNIRLEDGRVFQIRHLSHGVHSLSEIDLSKLPREAQPILPQATRERGGRGGRDSAFASSLGGNKCLTDPSSDIDVMVVYTATARAAAGGTDNMVALVYLSVAETNQSYFNSNLTHRVRLVHVTEVSYTESGNITTDLSRLRNTDGFIDNVLTLRNTYGADNVVMITNNGGGACGLAYFMDPVAASFESYAFAVVARTCAAANLSFPHELGHNMSADHDCANASSTGPYRQRHRAGSADRRPGHVAVPLHLGPQQSRSFIQHGKVTVNLGEKLAQVWKEGGEWGRGFRAAEGGALTLVDPDGAVLENIELDPKFVGKMTLTFTRTEATPKERFYISVRQVDEKGEAVGGVSYEIRNNVDSETNPGDPD